MAKKKTTYDLFARIVVPDHTDPSTISKIIQRACNNNGWDYSDSIEEEMSAEIPMLEDLLEVDDE